VPLSRNEKIEGNYVVTGPNGDVACSISTKHDNERILEFVATVKSLGFAQYSISVKESDEKTKGT
jgi:hypothetical protein